MPIDGDFHTITRVFFLDVDVVAGFLHLPYRNIWSCDYVCHVITSLEVFVRSCSLVSHCFYLVLYIPTVSIRSCSLCFHLVLYNLECFFLFQPPPLLSMSVSLTLGSQWIFFTDGNIQVRVSNMNFWNSDHLVIVCTFKVIRPIDLFVSFCNICFTLFFNIYSIVVICLNFFFFYICCM